MTEIDQPELDRRVDEILNRQPAVGLAVGIIRNGVLESFSGRGVTTIDSAIPVTEDTVFRIASITKIFTAVAVMQLVEQGLIDLDVARQRLPAGVSADAGKLELASGHGATSADPHRRRPGVGAPDSHRQQRLVRGELCA